MLAIIPARAGSKGVIGKNIKALSGIPLIAHTILAALDSNSVDRVIVSTDSYEIAEVAEKYGAEIPFLRPDAISHDSSAILDTYKHVLNKLEEEGDLYDSFVALQPTSPFRNSDDIDSAISLFNHQETDSIISFTSESHPIEWSRLINQDKTFRDLGMSSIYNRQKYKKTYYFNGAVYVLTKKIINQNIIYTKNSLAYVMPRSRSLDIDTEEDFQYAEFLMDKLKK